jgi:hypothetical protein
MSEQVVEKPTDQHPMLAEALHRARRATEYRQALAPEHVALLVSRIDALEAGLRDIRTFVASVPAEVDTDQDGILSDSYEAERLCRDVAVDMKAQNLQWRLDPSYILKICDGLNAARMIIAAQAKDLLAMSAGLAPISPRMNAELMRGVLREIASFRPRTGEGEGVREWNRAQRRAAVAASHALRVASYSPIYDDAETTETLASYPDSARIVIRDHDGDTADTGLTVGKLTILLSRCQAFEQLTHDRKPTDAVAPLVERLAHELVTKLDELDGLPDDIRRAIAELDTALISQDEYRRTPE